MDIKDKTEGLKFYTSWHQGQALQRQHGLMYFFIAENFPDKSTSDQELILQRDEQISESVLYTS